MNYLLLFGAVILGFIVATIFKIKALKNVNLYLAFSGAFLLGTTIFELLPEAFNTHDEKIPLFIVIGLLIQICLEFFSKGAEHGHFHTKNSNKAFPILLFVSLSIHALLEGMPISHHHNLLFAIIIHKLPIAIILSLFFYESGYSKYKTLILILIFASMSPLGLFIMNFIPSLTHFSSEITAIVIGIILHVSSVILFESSKNHTFNLAKFITILSAFFLAYLL